MQMAASRMAYFNAHAAVAAAFLPHNMGSAGGPLGLHPQSSAGMSYLNKTIKIINSINNCNPMRLYM